MALYYERGICDLCGQEGIVSNTQKVSHVMHFILTLLSGGMWGFVWLGCWLWKLERGQKICSMCRRR
jgi:hypothetical protein